MAAPVVQNLDQILAELEPAFGTTRNLYNQQINALPGAEQAATQQLEYAKTNSFRDIARSANSRGLDFWGVPIEEQSRYLGEHFLPGMAKVKQGTQAAQTQLQLALAELEKDKYTRGIDRRTQQESALQAWNSEQERLRIEREKMAAEDRRHAASLAAQKANRPAQVNPAKEFLNYIAGQFKSSGGQGNANVTRQQQDRWAEAFFAQNNVPIQARQGYWDLFNSTYNRSANYWEDHRYRR